MDIVTRVCMGRMEIYISRQMLQNWKTSEKYLTVHMEHTLVCFVKLWYQVILPIFLQNHFTGISTNDLSWKI